MTPTDEQIRLAIAQQAADWFVAHQSGSLDEAGRGAFLGWLKTSPVHVDEYLRMAAISRGLRVAAADPRIPLESWLEEARSQPVDNVASLTPSIQHGESFRKSWWLHRRLLGAVAATVLAALAAGLLMFWTETRELLGLRATYETGHGQQRSWQLSDGSALRLNTDSAVRVHFSPTQRLVEVTRGQALFRVAHEVRRQFRVVVGGAALVAVGTQFEVYRQGSTVLVTVIQGRVAVLQGDAGDALARPASDQLPAGTLTLGAAQQVRIESGKVVGKPAIVDLHQMEAWLSGQIAFEHRPLGEIADEFNRYADVSIEIVDPSLRTVLVSGVIDEKDLESFVAFLRAMEDVEIERTPSRIKVFRRHRPGREGS
jgi:transmembrane sensor